MLPSSVAKTNLGVGGGIVLQLAGFALSNSDEPIVAMAGSLVILASIPVLVWGCMHYAQGKGHNKWVGLVGLAGCIGLIVLIILPDQAKDAASQLALANRLEAGGDINAALAVYRSICKSHPGTEWARDAEASLRAIDARSSAGRQDP